MYQKIDPERQQESSTPEQIAEDSDVRRLQMAARMVELAFVQCIFSGLQKALNKPSNYRDPAIAKDIRSQIGRLLLGLRWHISFRHAFYLNQVNVESFMHLTKVLYFYYFAASTELPRHDLNEDPKRNCWFEDRDKEVVADFPQVNSVEGWEAWIEQGKREFCDSLARENISRSGAASYDDELARFWTSGLFSEGTS